MLSPQTTRLLFVIASLLYLTNASSFNCTVLEPCNEIDLNCAEDEDCEVECTGRSACESSRIQCPVGEGLKCNVTCTGDFSCRWTEINSINKNVESDLTLIADGDYSFWSWKSVMYCGYGNCHVECNGESACSSSKMYGQHAAFLTFSTIGEYASGHTQIYCPRADTFGGEVIEGSAKCSINADGSLGRPFASTDFFNSFCFSGLDYHCTSPPCLNYQNMIRCRVRETSVGCYLAESNGQLICADPLNPVADAWPATNIDLTNVNVISCVGLNECRDDTLICPDGKDCLVQCIGKRACSDTTIQCPTTAHLCDVQCVGDQACWQTPINENSPEVASSLMLWVEGIDTIMGVASNLFCGTGTCEVTCIGENACLDIDLDGSMASSLELFARGFYVLGFTSVKCPPSQSTDGKPIIGTSNCKVQGSGINGVVFPLIEFITDYCFLDLDYSCPTGGCFSTSRQPKLTCPTPEMGTCNLQQTPDTFDELECVDEVQDEMFKSYWIERAGGIAISGPSLIFCPGNGVCKDQKLTCHEDADCYIECRGNEACAGAQIQCPSGDDYLCSITCEGSRSCMGATINELDPDIHSTVKVVAIGDTSIGGIFSTLQCGKGECTVDCRGPYACLRFEIFAQDATSLEVSAVGNDALYGVNIACPPPLLDNGTPIRTESTCTILANGSGGIPVTGVNIKTYYCINDLDLRCVGGIRGLPAPCIETVNPRFFSQLSCLIEDQTQTCFLTMDSSISQVRCLNSASYVQLDWNQQSALNGLPETNVENTEGSSDSDDNSVYVAIIVVLGILVLLCGLSLVFVLYRQNQRSGKASFSPAQAVEIETM